MNRLKRAAAVFLLLLLAVPFTACGADEDYEGAVYPNDPDTITLQVFAPKSSVGIVSTAVNAYRSYAEDVTIQITYDDGAMLASKIEAGYECDIYLADSPDYLDWLDSDSGKEKIPTETTL